MKAFDRRFCSSSDGFLFGASPIPLLWQGARPTEACAAKESVTMSTIVFIEMPASGHVNPTLPVVQELVRRGEHVTYYTTEEFRYPQPSTVHPGHKRIRRTFTS